jgi:hypothetical protein
MPPQRKPYPANEPAKPEKPGVDQDDAQIEEPKDDAFKENAKKQQPSRTFEADRFPEEQPRSRRTLFGVDAG